MARRSEFYKGRRKKRNYALIPFAVLLAVIAVVVVSFYGMQKYAVVTKDGVSVELPIFSDGEEPGTIGSEQKVFEPVEVQLVFDEADYSGVEQQPIGELRPLRAIFVPAENINEEKLIEYEERINMGNALVLEMKPRTGQLMFNSNTDAAVKYGLSAAPEISANVQSGIDRLKESGVYLVAQISCCIDNFYTSRSTTVALKNAYGSNYTDENGVWLDPYNRDLRDYIVQLCRELYDMGFDEVVLADVMHPVLEKEEKEQPVLPEGQTPPPDFVYSREMSTTPSPVNAVCGFALSIARQLLDRDGVLSVYINSPQSLVRADTANGQDGPLFFKIFDRVYYPTDKYAFSYNVGDVESSVKEGRIQDRFVPVVINYLPNDAENLSWVLIDKEVKED